MKTILLLSLLVVPAALSAQSLSPLQSFKSKDAKVSNTNLHDLSIAGNNNIELVAFIKKKQAEKITLGPDLSLISREEVEFDFDADEKRIGGRFFDYTYHKSEVVKADVLEVASADILSRISGLNMIPKGRVGLKNSPNFKLQKGDIKLSQSESQTTSYYGSYGSSTTGSNAVYTWFDVKEELKFKSDQGKNLGYEFHSSNGESIQASMKVILAKVLQQMKRKGKDHKEEAELQEAVKNYKALTEADADLLLIAKRNPVYKFGKAPSTEDMLPEYYAFRFSPSTMEIVEKNSFQEHISRATVFREALRLNEGILLVSAPTSLFKPRDPNTHNYVFRLIGNDTRLKFELQHTVSSGYTQFSQAFELPDSSIVLLAGCNGRKTDKYINQYMSPFNTKTVYTLTIKNGKIIHEETISEDSWDAGFKIPAGDVLKKEPYDPSLELTEHIATQPLPDGGLITFWSAQKTDSKGKLLYIGDVALQFSALGKLEARYWVACKEQALKRATSSVVIPRGKDELYWITFEPVFEKEESRVVKSVATKEKAGYANPVITRINTTARSISAKTIAGNDKYVVGESFPYIIEDDAIRFFGFDKGGKEFWTQKLSF